MSITTNNTKTIIYDAHACPPFGPESDISTLVRYKNAGVTFVSLNVGFGDMTETDILPIITRIRNFIDSNLSDYRLVNTVEDITSCKFDNKLGIAFDLEGANALAGKPESLDLYFKLGIKQALLVYNKNNSAGGGCQDIDTGLTSYGKTIVKRMNDLGMIIDCSHAGLKTSLDIIERSTQPVVFSHSNPFALCDHPRNIKDDQIKACAQTGGVIGINGINIFLGCNTPTVNELVNHIDYVAQLVGVNHVGIGLDYVLDHDDTKALVKGNPALFPADQKYDMVELLAPEEIPNISVGLVNKGYKDSDIQAILGGNFMRVAKQVWRS